MDKKVLISIKSSLKGEDGYKIFSVRLRDETVADLEHIAAKTNRSRNEIVGILLDFAIANCEIEDIKEPRNPTCK